jgi:dTDP-4-dehydrorhamnose 3,5-epimerase
MSLFAPLADNARRFEDRRGWLEILYESDTTVLKRSFSKRNVFRGLHVQRGPSAQVKLIRVCSGRILDFVAAIENGSARIEQRELTPESGWVRIAPDLAHGFFAREDSVFEYVCDGRYNEGAEESWSIAHYLVERGLPAPILSDKDASAKPLAIRESVA